ncbi:hypothetical protein ACET98_14220, partial [Aeromonas veronii]
GDVSALRIRVFTLAGMAVQLRRNTQGVSAIIGMPKSTEAKSKMLTIFLITPSHNQPCTPILPQSHKMQP